MKKTTHCKVAQEKARVALDEVEAAFGVKTGLKAGDGLHLGWSEPHNKNGDGPIISPLYGVVIAPA
jgi:hypothetical protein